MVVTPVECSVVTKVKQDVVGVVVVVEVVFEVVEVVFVVVP
jgi:hypothetical protein